MSWRSKRAEHAPSGGRLGPYRLVAEIGRGGMGIVYHAEDETSGDEIALKVLRQDLSTDAAYRRRFLHEARAAAEVRHPNLVRMLGTGEASGWQYIAFSYVRGRSLEARIAESPLPMHEVVPLLEQVAAGLDSLHAHGVVHRDVKPSNVLLADGGGAVLTDFGLAKGRDYSVITQLGQVMGTLDYLAPELIRGQPAAAASDIYALGCVVFECIAGAPPFAARSVLEVGMAHLHDPPPDPSARRLDMPRGVGAAVLTALAKAPPDRPATASDYAQTVRMASGGGPARDEPAQ